VLSEKKKQELLALSENINPFQLREGFYQSLKELFSLPNSVLLVTEGVFQTFKCLKISYSTVAQ
jgi:hypothetical protein